MRLKLLVAAVCFVCFFCSCARDLRVERGVPYARPLGRENASPTPAEVERGVPYARPLGRQLRLNVYQVKTRPAEPLPAIVAIHGGAWLHGPRTQQWWYLHEFARRGYVVFAVDYRILPRYAFPNCLYDVKGAVRWVRLHAGEYGVDPDRIFAFGASAGGHLSAFLATSVPEDGFEGEQNTGVSSAVSAAISLYGAVDLTKFRDPPERRWFNPVWRSYVWKFVREADWAAQGQDPYVYASPVTYARPFSKPIFFIHGKRDSIVHSEQSVDAHARLAELGVPTDLMLFEGRGHAFDYSHWRERKEAFARMLEFLEVHGGTPAGTVYSDKAEPLPAVDGTVCE